MTRILFGLLAFTTGLIGLQFAGAQPTNPAALFKLGDGNKDGKLSFDEFRASFRETPSSRTTPSSSSTSSSGSTPIAIST